MARILQRIQYNSPVILSFSLLAVAVHLLNIVIPQFTLKFFVINPFMSFSNPLDYFRLFSYVLGHASWDHLFGNLAFILLLGPILEEKYGSKSMLIMILITAVSSAILCGLIFHTAALGASGIVFMLIVLASIVDVRAGTIPLTFVLVAAIFLGREIVQISQADNISQLGHIAGGTFGALFGFSSSKLFSVAQNRASTL
jgi:membrane associated rhomboid family serine protease